MMSSVKRIVRDWYSLGPQVRFVNSSLYACFWLDIRHWYFCSVCRLMAQAVSKR